VARENTGNFVDLAYIPTTLRLSRSAVSMTYGQFPYLGNRETKKTKQANSVRHQGNPDEVVGDACWSSSAIQDDSYVVARLSS
jgi:hypothetical protein